MVQKPGSKPLRRRLVVLIGLLGACAAEPSSVFVAQPVRHVLGDQFVLTLPQDARSLEPMPRESLRRRIAQLGLRLDYEFSDRVGLAHSVTVSGELSSVMALRAELPGLRVAPSVLRGPVETNCGNKVCDSDEAATSVRGSTCSLDCGAHPIRPLRDELSNSWQVAHVGADRVWPTSLGQNVPVCIIDTGFDSGAVSTHPDHPSVLSAGYNFVSRSADYRDIGDHGTHVTGIVAAARNGTGSVGIAPEASIRIYQVFRLRNGIPVASDADVIAALDAAVGDGCRVVNMSLGGSSDSEAEHTAIQRAYQSGILVVAAAGNSEDAARGAIGTAASSFPGAYPESFTVGAVDRSGALASFSGTGPSVSVVAPGVDIYSSVPVGKGQREVVASFVTDRGSIALDVVLPDGSAGTSFSQTPVTSCGFGSPSEVQACQPVGQVALIARGPSAPGQTAIPFYDKIRSARQAGAVGVLLYNHRFGDPQTAGAIAESISLGGGHPVPVLSLAAGDGEALVNRVEQGTLSVSAQVSPSDYAVLEGTSMAAPVVSGVAALLWSAYPSLSHVALRQLLSESAVDLGAPGRDDFYGSGRIDAGRALLQASPRGRCGDGIRDRQSEICDGSSTDGSTCDDLGYDGVLGGQPGCNVGCTGLVTGTCQCVAGRTPFESQLSVDEDFQVSGGLKGTRFRYRIVLQGQPAQGVRVQVRIARDGKPLILYVTEPSDSSGIVTDFIPYDGTGLAAGTYQVIPLLTKGDERCRDNQPVRPAEVSIKIRS